MEEGLLSLKWNNHKSTFFQVLSVLREKHTYTDVTLACDGRLYPAHKFVLSTCSEYFSDIFTSTSGTSIVIVLKDVRRQDLEYLMDYMYLGQVDVAQSELPSLIKTAECLRIKGLAIPDDEPHKNPRRSAEEQEGSPPPSKKKRYLQEEDRPSTTTSSTSSTTNNNNNTTTSSSSLSSTSASGRLQMEARAPPSDLGSLVQHLRQVPLHHPPLQAPPPPPPTSQGGSKSHTSQPLSLNLTTPAARSSQGGSSSGPHSLTPTSTQPSHPPLSSPSHSTPVPVIKEEAADPPETPEGYLNESFEENETKPNVSDPRHLDSDGAVPGPSGLQGSADNWDGDGDMVGYSGGDGYPEGSLEEQGESEVQGRDEATTGIGRKKKGSAELEDTSGRSSVPSHQLSQPSAQDSEVTHPSLNPPHRGKWCSGAAFSTVQRNNIMNLIPMYETRKLKFMRGSIRKPGSSKKPGVTMKSTNATPHLQERQEKGENLCRCIPEDSNLQCLRHRRSQGGSRLEPQRFHPMTFGSLTYSPERIVVNLTTYSSVPSSCEEPVGKDSTSVSSSSSTSSSSAFSSTSPSSSSSSSSSSALASSSSSSSFLPSSSSSSVSEAGKSSAITQTKKLNVCITPEKKVTKQPVTSPSENLILALSSQSSPQPLRIITHSPLTHRQLSEVTALSSPPPPPLSAQPRPSKALSSPPLFPQPRTSKVLSSPPQSTQPRPSKALSSPPLPPLSSQPRPSKAFSSPPPPPPLSPQPRPSKALSSPTPPLSLQPRPSKTLSSPPPPPLSSQPRPSKAPAPPPSLYQKPRPSKVLSSPPLSSEPRPSKAPSSPPPSPSQQQPSKTHSPLPSPQLSALSSLFFCTHLGPSSSPSPPGVKMPQLLRLSQPVWSKPSGTHPPPPPLPQPHSINMLTPPKSQPQHAQVYTTAPPPPQQHQQPNMPPQQPLKPHIPLQAQRPNKTPQVKGKKEKDIMESITSDTTINVRTTTSTSLYQTKTCRVLVPKIPVCPHCFVVLRSVKRLKQHIHSCQKLPLVDVKIVPEHNYCFHA